MDRKDLLGRPPERFVHDLRVAKGLSKSELSKRTGYSARSFDYWESGERNMTLESFCKILDAIGYEVKFVFSEKQVE